MGRREIDMTESQLDTGAYFRAVNGSKRLSVKLASMSIVFPLFDDGRKEKVCKTWEQLEISCL